MTRFFLGVDAGGSHCRSRLVDANGRVLAEAQAGPANAGLGLITLHATLRDVTDRVVRQAGLDAADVAQTSAAMPMARS
jgi:glucosamine kinase